MPDLMHLPFPVVLLGAGPAVLPGATSTLWGPLAALCSSLTWAYGSSIYTREARRVGAVEVNLARAVIVLPLFLLCAWFVSGPSALYQVGRARLLWLALSVLCSYGFGDLLFYLAAMRLDTSTALAIASVYPVWAVLAGALTLSEAIGPSRIGGTLLCVAGVAWLVLLGRAPAALSGHRPKRTFAGVALALLASMLWAGNAYSVRRGADGLSLFLANAIRYTLTVLCLLPAWALFRQQQRRRDRGHVPASPPATLFRPRVLFVFAGTAVIEAFIGSSVFVYGLSHADLSVAAPLSSLSPLFAVPIGLLLGVETLDLRRVCAICLTVAGVVLLVI